MSKPISLSNHVILITGASAGIGAALAPLLAHRHAGIRLILTARRAEALEQVAIVCRQAGAEVMVFPVDLNQPDEVTTLVSKVRQQVGRVDALVNNAGYSQMGAIELVDREAVLRQFQVNLLAPIALMQAVIPVMRQQGGGRIINISSLAGRFAFPLNGLYSASKFALEGLSDALRMEVEPFNITVSLVEPGPVATEFVAVAKQKVADIQPPIADTPYRAALPKLETLEQRVTNQLWSAEQVAKVIDRALTDTPPKPRYVAATGGRWLVRLMLMLPTRWRDRFWQRFYGIDLIRQESSAPLV